MIKHSVVSMKNVAILFVMKRTLYPNIIWSVALQRHVCDILVDMALSNYTLNMRNDVEICLFTLML